MSVSLIKASLRIDWACYWIIDDSIFHFPGSRIPVRLLTQLKEIDFLGEKFLVPNPPEEYLRFKYGDDWMTPKRKGYEKDILDLIPATLLPGRAGRLKRLLTGRLLPWRACKLRVLDRDDKPVSNADVVIHGLGRYRTNKHGYTKFYPPGREWFAFVISYDGHEEVLYMEEVYPGETYVYRPNPTVTSGRWSAFLPG